MRFLSRTAFLFIFISIILPNAIAQDFESDLIKALNSESELPKTHDIKFSFFSEKKIWKYNPIFLSFGGLLYTYQKLISPQISASCAYEINCSNFSKLSIKKFGIIKGIALTSDRLTRCTKLASYDIHPLNINEFNQVIDHPDNYILYK